MDTAKVDVRKLQLLNDRITQTIDALNQVRLSVHGLQHTSPVTGTPGIGTNPYAGYGMGVGQVPYAQPAMPQYAAVNPWLNPMGIGHTPFVQGAVPAWIPQAQLGLGHTPFGLGQADLLDPYAATRYAQTFPFAFAGVSPFLSAI